MSSRLSIAFVLVVSGVLVVAATAYLARPSFGTLAIRVQDSPAGWMHLNVTFQEVRVHRANAGNESGWVAMALSSRTIDFIGPGNLSQLLALDQVPAGKYTQLRIVVGSAVGTLEDGSTVNLTVPSGILRTTTPFHVPQGGTTAVTLEFDLARSIHESDGRWIFSPVLGPIHVG